MEKKRDEKVEEQEDMVFGDNNVATHMSEDALKEREESFKANPDNEDSVIEGAQKTREKLNEKLNQVRNYGLDARELPM